MQDQANVMLEAGEFYTSFIEPFMKHASSSSKVDWAAWREALPAPHQASATENGRVHVEYLCVHHSSLSIAGGLKIHDGGILVVLGDLHVTGGVVAASHDYLAIVVGGKLCVDRLYVTGDVIVLGAIKAELWWGRGNNHSTCTPRLEVDT